MTAPLRKENARPSEPGTGDVTSDAVQGDIGHVTEDSALRLVREAEGAELADFTPPLSYDERRDFYTDGQYCFDALPHPSDREPWPEPSVCPECGHAEPCHALWCRTDGEPRDRVEVPL